MGSEEKGELALSLGCDDIILYRHESFSKKILEWTASEGVNVILDSIGGATFSEGLLCVANFGRIAVFGMASGEPGQTTTDLLQHTNRGIIGYSLSGHRSTRPETLRQAGQVILNYIQEGSLKMIIGAHYPLSQAAKAHRWIEERHSVGKVILLP